MAGRGWHEYERAVEALARRLFDLAFEHRSERARDLMWGEHGARTRWLHDARDMLQHAWEEAAG